MQDQNRTSRVLIGEGFAGTIAATRKPLAIQRAFEDPLVKSRVIKERAILALYGVPLLQDDELLGVAHMGSTRADEFTIEDRHLFGSVAARIAVGSPCAPPAAPGHRASRRRNLRRSAHPPR